MKALTNVIWGLLAVISAAGFLYGISPIFNPSVHFNLGYFVIMFCCAAFGCFAIFHKGIFSLVKSNAAVRTVFCIIVGLAVIFVIATAVISALMIKSANDKPNDPQAIIILGCRVNGDVPSAMLMQRINAAYKYLEKFPNAVAIASGGQGNDENFSEAECIRLYLEKKGISSDRIIIEDNSTSTRENMLFSRQILDEMGISGEIAIVSNEYHLLRARTIAKRQGLDVKCCAARTVPIYLPPYWVREIFGNVYEWAKD